MNHRSGGLGQIPCTGNRGDGHLNPVVIVLGEGEGAIGIVELEGEGQVMVVAGEVNAPIPRLPVHIDRRNDGRIRVIDLPSWLFLVNILREFPGEVIAPDIETVRALVEYHLREMKRATGRRRRP